MTESIRVGVVGARGRMGSQACQAISTADGLELSAQLGSADPLGELVNAGVKVAVDLTRPDVVMNTVRFCIHHEINCVVGTSGIEQQQLEEITGLLAGLPAVGIIVVPNFAIGAVLAMRFARLAAPFFAGVEVIELHHAGKADAPSGTAAATARGIATARSAASSAPMPDATTADPGGARGADIDGVHVHSVRLPGLVAHQEVLLAGDGELLTIRHDSLHRGSFMPGMLLSVRQAPLRAGLTIGLESLLELD
jgi:4-hydroxy-tetrahydrodipicolinate reductase